MSCCESEVRNIQIRETEQTKIPHQLLSRCLQNPTFSAKSSLLHLSKMNHAACFYMEDTFLDIPDILKSVQQLQSWFLPIQFLYSSHSAPRSDLTSNPEGSLHILTHATCFPGIFKNHNTVHLSVGNHSPVFPTACTRLDIDLIASV